MIDICIVSMPYGSLTRPSLGMGLLVSNTKKNNLKIKALYPTFEFAKKIGINLYFLLSEIANPIDLLGEWTFSGAAFPEFSPEHEEYFSFSLNSKGKNRYFYKIFQSHSDNKNIKEKLWEIREKSTKFVNDTAEKILKMKPKIVACSSIFFQNCASLALLRKIKELNPYITTIMGGSNCEAEMGYILKKHFKWVDFVMSGEGDYSFPALCKNILSKGKNLKGKDLPFGVFSEKNIDTFENNKSMPVSIVSNINELPYPDYDDYFESLNSSPLRHYIIETILVEGSRGCWKGCNSPCAFCGLNGERSKYRSKSPERLLKELDFLSNKYGINKFFMTDTILNMKYFNTLLLNLKKRKAPYLIFFETISKLNEEQIKILSESGVKWIQPGIESLNDSILKELNKGNSAVDNITLLKYLHENGIRASWNMLVAVPNSKNDWYVEMSKLIPYLHHLQPPNASPIRFDRFSTYHKKHSRYNIKLKPAKAYNYVYPLSEDALKKFSYFFDDTDFNNRISTVKNGIELLIDKLRTWAKNYKNRKPILEVYENETSSTIIDTRLNIKGQKIILEGNKHIIYKLCRHPVSKEEIINKLKIPKLEVDTILNDLIKKGLLVYISNKYLALATYKPKSNFLKNDNFPGGKIKAIILDENKLNKKNKEILDWF